MKWADINFPYLIHNIGVNLWHAYYLHFCLASPPTYFIFVLFLLDFWWILAVWLKWFNLFSSDDAVWDLLVERKFLTACKNIKILVQCLSEEQASHCFVQDSIYVIIITSRDNRCAGMVLLQDRLLDRLQLPESERASLAAEENEIAELRRKLEESDGQYSDLAADNRDLKQEVRDLQLEMEGKTAAFDTLYS